MCFRRAEHALEVFKRKPPVSYETSGFLAAGEGFEPSHTESESAVLPLHNPAIFQFLFSSVSHEQVLLYRKI